MIFTNPNLDVLELALAALESSVLVGGASHNGRGQSRGQIGMDDLALGTVLQNLAIDISYVNHC